MILYLYYSYVMAFQILIFLICAIAASDMARISESSF